MSQIFSQRFLKRLRRQENGNRCLEAPADQQRARALLTSVEPAELASCESCCDKGVNVSDTLLEAKLPPAQWFDRFIGLGANSRHVSSDDTIACVRLVVAELQGSQAARETEIRLVTPTVPLSALYAECERLTGCMLGGRGRAPTQGPRPTRCAAQSRCANCGALPSIGQ